MRFASFKPSSTRMCWGTDAGGGLELIATDMMLILVFSRLPKICRGIPKQLSQETTTNN